MLRDEAVAEIRQHLAASPARVFAAFADQALVSRWLTPSPDVALRVVQFDFRVGGAYRFAHDVPGGATMFVNGVYRKIEPPSTLVFSWNIEPPDEHAGVRSEVAVTLTPRGAGHRPSDSSRATHTTRRLRATPSRLARRPRSADCPVRRRPRAHVNDWGRAMKRYLLAVLAYLLPTFVLGFVWHVVLFQSYYEALAIYTETSSFRSGFYRC